MFRHVLPCRCRLNTQRQRRIPFGGCQVPVPSLTRYLCL
jgi:hypothetical protein